MVTYLLGWLLTYVLTYLVTYLLGYLVTCLLTYLLTYKKSTHRDRRHIDYGEKKMATMKREKKQPLTKLAKAAKTEAAKTGPPASVSSTDDGLFIDLLLLDEADNNAVINRVRFVWAYTNV